MGSRKVKILLDAQAESRSCSGMVGRPPGLRESFPTLLLGPPPSGTQPDGPLTIKDQGGHHQQAQHVAS